MVILQRTELSRNRALYFLAILLSLAVLAGTIMGYSSQSSGGQLLYLVLGLSAIAALALAVIQLYGFPKRSHALIIQTDDGVILATNAVHEGFKLRFLRDVLTENVFSFSDEERERWKSLEQDGYFPSLRIRNVRKVLLLRLCTMVFDDVFAVDSADRWEHHDSSSTSEPSFHRREMPPLRSWKRSGDISA